MKTSYISLLFVSLFIISAFSGLAGDLDKSGKGTVVLNDNSVYYGDITYNQELDLVSVVKQGKTFTFTTHQVQVFQYFDCEKELNRIYTSVEVSEPNAYYSQPKLRFLEMVVHGDVSILRCETYKMVENYESNDRTLLLKRNIVSEPTLVIGFDYYFTKSGYTQKLTNFKKQVLPLLNNQPLITRFIHENGVDLASWKGQYQVIEFYNNLDEKDKSFFTDPTGISL